MLSVNDDPRMMMKGITHGACFYLLKPVRVEDLKNIWQHVIRRKKVDSKEQKKTNNQDKPDSGSCNELVSPVTENSDQNAKPTKKRKDQDEDDDEDLEHGHDYEDPSSQKKPRVVWSPELHRKFISAIDQLGIDSKFFTLSLHCRTIVVIDFIKCYLLQELNQINSVFIISFLLAFFMNIWVADSNPMFRIL